MDALWTVDLDTMLMTAALGGVGGAGGGLSVAMAGAGICIDPKNTSVTETAGVDEL